MAQAQVGARAGMDMALAASAVLALAGTLIAWRIWPREDSDTRQDAEGGY
jgi:hypothetical protein